VIRHLFSSAAPDDSNPSNVQGRHWNDDHQIDDPTALTAALNVFTSSLKGLVPASGGSIVNFLRADGAWASTAGRFFDKIITPPQISISLGDWNVGTLGNITLVLGTTDGTREVGGLVGGSDGKIVVVLNVSDPISQTILFLHDVNSASVGNRFINANGGSVNGGAGGCVAYYYHGPSFHWRNIWST
jgi:hypothetical protein